MNQNKIFVEINFVNEIIHRISFYFNKTYKNEFPEYQLAREGQQNNIRLLCKYRYLYQRRSSYSSNTGGENHEKLESLLK